MDEERYPRIVSLHLNRFERDDADVSMKKPQSVNHELRL